MQEQVPIIPQNAGRWFKMYPEHQTIQWLDSPAACTRSGFNCGFTCILTWRNGACSCCKISFVFLVSSWFPLFFLFIYLCLNVLVFICSFLNFATIPFIGFFVFSFLFSFHFHCTFLIFFVSLGSHSTFFWYVKKYSANTR